MRLKVLFALWAGMFLAGAVSAQITAPPPPPPLDPENTLLLDLSTGGRVTIQLRPDVAPSHIERIKSLARRGFYNGLTFHRVIEGFMAQTGDPTGDGTGGSELPDIAAEFNGLPHVRGTVSMARSADPNSANSQFFIMFAPRFTLDRNYTAFGRVIGGMNFVDTIERGEPPAQPSRILRASIGADNLPPPAPGEVIVAPAAPPAAAPPLSAPPAGAAPSEAASAPPAQAPVGTPATTTPPAPPAETAPPPSR